VRWVIDAMRLIRDDIHPIFYRALAASLSLLIGSTVLLRFTHQRPPGMSWIDALYFSTETIATVGYGDFSFIDQPAWLRIWGISVMSAGVTTTAILVAFVADVLLSRRLAQSAGRRKVRHVRHHIIVVGLGSFGIRVVRDLVIAITRPGKPVLLQPRRDTKLRATDTAYLVGPYRELLDTLRKGQSATRTLVEAPGRRTP